MISHWIRKPLRAALGLGLCVAFGASAQAAGPGPHWQVQPNCCPSPYAPAPYSPAPNAPAPSDLPPDESKPADPNADPRADPMADPMAQPMDPNAQAPQAQDPGAQPQAAPMGGFQGAAPGAAGIGGGGAGGAGTAILGRLDSNNRFNLFDNMSAIPRSRVWASYIYSKGTSTDVKVQDTIGGAYAGALSSGTIPDVRNRFAQHAFRGGLEYALSDDFSVAVQGQYVVNEDPQVAEDWTNPQFLAKYVLYRSYCQDLIVSGTLGYAPEVSSDTLVVRDNEARVYPGLLAYYQVDEDLFLNMGTQVNIALEGDRHAWDWSLGAGYWAYRHESIDPRFNVGFANGGYYGGGYHGACGGCSSCCEQPLLLGVVPKIELFGHHVLTDATVNNPYGINSNSAFASLLSSGVEITSEEPRHIIDLTVGSTFVLRDNISIGSGISLPLTTGRDVARQFEVLTTINYGF